VIEAAVITGHKTLNMLGRYANLNVDKIAKKLNAPPPSTTAEAKDDVYAELSKLNNLKKEGALNQTEFNKQKKILLEKHNRSV
jgi:hypothetical protein